MAKIQFFFIDGLFIQQILNYIQKLRNYSLLPRHNSLLELKFLDLHQHLMGSSMAHCPSFQGVSLKSSWFFCVNKQKHH